MPTNPTIFFTSDTHANHGNIVRLSSRPFDCVRAMEDALVEKWNSVVQPADTVYHLGDVALSWGRKHADAVDEFIRRLNGHKHLILGNHDRKEVYDNPRWESVSHYKEIKLDIGEKHKQRIVMSHYCHRVWNQMHRGAIHLYGHSHGSLPDPGGKCMDVGVDCHNYTPISLGFVLDFMRDRGIQSHDHHAPEQS